MLLLAAYAWGRMLVAPGKPVVGERTSFAIPAAATSVAAGAAKGRRMSATSPRTC
jgi:hypothetical protein